MNKMVKRVAGGVGLALVSVGAFAQASSPIADSGIVSSISGVTTTVTDIGMAVLGVVVVVYAFKLVKGFIGR